MKKYDWADKLAQGAYEKWCREPYGNSLLDFMAEEMRELRRQTMEMCINLARIKVAGKGNLQNYESAVRERFSE